MKKERVHWMVEDVGDFDESIFRYEEGQKPGQSMIKN